MKKIGILTYHACFNYGACLQAYALQQTIIKYQPDCEIIDYQSDILRDISDVFSKKPKHSKEVIKNLTRLPYFSQLVKRQKMFENFISNDLLTSQRYRTEKEVEIHAEDYECIVCGSDQTWNLEPSIRYQNPVYYLNFPKKQRRVSYATSFGDWVEKAQNHEDVFLPWVKTYDSLSMREDSGVKYLQSKGLECELVLDPTLLLTSQEYDKICSEPIMKEPYVLLFSWNGAKEAVEVTKKIAKELKCKPIYIVAPPRAMFSGIERKLDVGPKEFLSLIKNAEFVVTNSFHGTVFSALYEKPFVSVVSGKADTRRQSLLKQLGLLHHLVTPEELNLNDIKSTDFKKVKKQITILKQKSLDYLKRAINVNISEEMNTADKLIAGE